MPQHYYHRPPTSRQRPSSQHHRANTSAYVPPVQRALNDGDAQSMYPGVEPHYPHFGQMESSSVVPYGQNMPGEHFYGDGPGPSGRPPAPSQSPSSSSSTGFSLANIGELKGMIDRFGGIDGIIGGIGKMQKVVGSIQQMAPMVKLFMGMLPFGKKGSDSSAADKDFEDYKSSRKRKRKSSKKSSGTTRRRKTNTTKRPTKSSKR